MRLLLCAAVALLLATPAQAFHKLDHVPPGQALPVCDCLAVEIRQSVFENSERLVFDQSLRNLVGVLTVMGEMECVEPESGFVGSGEATLRHIIFLLDGIQSQDQEFCR